MDEIFKVWMGDMGDDYTKRNVSSEENIKQRGALFFKILNDIRCNPKSIAEIGSGGGANLSAIRQLLGTSVELISVEPNPSARAQANANHPGSIDKSLDGHAGDIPLADATVGLVFTSGVLIHIPPESLGKAMDEIHRVSSRWIVAIEYFNPDLIGVIYREQDGLLWKGDYGSMYLDRFPDLRCVSYGFEWKRETGLDNVTWWVLEKNP
jgi:pseudaminic acid biosynthesis-associated methylase